MSDFKLLAIRPLEGCNERFLKNLNPGYIYKFYRDYDYILDDNNDKVIKVNHKENILKSIYGENISVSAIVGKNGSGKSMS